MKKLCCCLLMLLMLIPSLSHAESTVYSLFDTNGQLITYYCGECETGDEYISRDNLHYRIFSVNADTKAATAECLGEADMPDVSWLELDQSSQSVASIGEKRIAIYCTHSDESYIEGDGTESVEGNGGIYDVANAFSKELEKLGVTIEISDATHLPHDAGAYRRSRQTAMDLLKTGPNAIFDIHRDGIPDPDEYTTTVANEKMSMVRLLVGKSNQNKDANMSFAKQIKVIADKIYPGLIKDIYIGKGTYNQDLAPRSVLLEFGTHTLPKNLVLKSVSPMAEVAYKALFGGVIGSAGTSDASGKSESTENVPATKDNTGSNWIIWLILALVVGLGLYAFLSTGGKGGMQKWKRSFSEMTGGLLGRKTRRDE